MNVKLPPLAPHCRRHLDLETLDWCDQLLDAVGTEVGNREALARTSKQDTLSLALCAQLAVVERLRAAVRRRFWHLAGGNESR